jgi:ClpP class serine protease
MTLLAELYASAWAVRPEVLSAVLRYVERHETSPEMLARAFHFDPSVQEAAQAARWNRYAVHQQTSVLVNGSAALYRRGQTAILPITGPIIRRGNLMSSLSGGPMTSVELLAKDFTRALEDDSFTSIVLDVDSPGGEAAGISELASIIRDGRSAKSITAYVGDLAASAAYWLASAAAEVVVNKTAAVGSIGVVMAVPDGQEREGYVEFVSSASPQKRPDPKSKAGAAQLQALVDVLGDLFVDDVAANRVVSRETVLEEFGAGGLKVGADAVASGMADRLGSFEEVLADLGRTEGKDTRRKGPAGPAPTPDDDELLDVLPDRPRSVPAPAAASVGGAPMGNLLDGLRQLVAAAEAPASADQEAQIMSLNASATNGTGTTTATPAHIVPTSSPPADLTGDATLRQRLVAAEAENTRLRFQQIQIRAEAFCREREDEMKSLAPERPHLMALYCLLASDDETHGPVQLGQGKTTTRVAHLENLLAAREGRRELTADMFDGVTKFVMAERQTPKVDPNAVADEAQIAAYLQQTATGRTVLAGIASVNR